MSFFVTGLVAFGFFAAFFFMIGLGVLLGRKPVRGSCGGVGPGGGGCEVCDEKTRGTCDRAVDHS